LHGGDFTKCGVQSSVFSVQWMVMCVMGSWEKWLLTQWEECCKVNHRLGWDNSH